MDLAWGEHFWREEISHSVHHEVCFSGLLRIHRRVGRKRELHEGVRERKRDSRRGHQAREIAINALTGVQSLVPMAFQKFASLTAATIRRLDFLSLFAV